MADRVILSPAVEADDTPVLPLVKVKLTQLTKRRTGDPVSQSEDGMPAGARVLANGGSPLIGCGGDDGGEGGQQTWG